VGECAARRRERILLRRSTPRRAIAEALASTLRCRCAIRLRIPNPIDLYLAHEIALPTCTTTLSRSAVKLFGPLAVRRRRADASSCRLR